MPFYLNGLAIFYNNYCLAILTVCLYLVLIVYFSICMIPNLATGLPYFFLFN